MQERWLAAGAPAGPRRRRARRVRRASSSQGVIAACSDAPSSSARQVRSHHGRAGGAFRQQQDARRAGVRGDMIDQLSRAVAGRDGATTPRRVAAQAPASACSSDQAWTARAAPTSPSSFERRGRRSLQAHRAAAELDRARGARALGRPDVAPAPCIDLHSEAPCGCSRPRRETTRTAASGFLPFASHRLETRQCPGATARTRGHPAGQASPSAFPARSPRA